MYSLVDSLVCALTKDQTYNFEVLVDTLSNWATHPGPKLIFFIGLTLDLAIWTILNEIFASLVQPILLFFIFPLVFFVVLCCCFYQSSNHSHPFGPLLSDAERLCKYLWIVPCLSWWRKTHKHHLHLSTSYFLCVQTGTAVPGNSDGIGYQVFYKNTKLCIFSRCAPSEASFFYIPEANPNDTCFLYQPLWKPSGNLYWLHNEKLHPSYNMFFQLQSHTCRNANSHLAP